MLTISRDDNGKDLVKKRRRGLLYDPHGIRQVEEIIKNVRERGLLALLEYSRKFDGVDLKPHELFVSKEELKLSKKRVNEDFKKSLELVIERIQAFHMREKPKRFIYQDKNEVLGSIINPLERVGVYIPGGRNPYPSTLLMTIIPAKVAGVAEILVATPPGKNREIDPHLLYTAHRLGVDSILRLGGAQAIAAMAFGFGETEAVHKIVGPGNIYVTLAKKILYGEVGIDMLAGPSEIAILADRKAPVNYIAADLLAQAEHDPLSIPLLFSTHEPLLKRVNLLLEEMIRDQPRQEIIRESLKEQGQAFLVKSIEEGIGRINAIAPEHLVLMVKEAKEYLPLIKHAGAIFLGAYTPQASGDYLAGPSHVIPTGGSARFTSPLGVESFVKRSSLISFQQERMKEILGHGALLAELEGLKAHQDSFTIREEEPYEECD